jgi:hypothetical protein
MPSESTPQDIDNAATRAAIAQRQKIAYVAVLKLALGAFGPGWLPSCRHDLVDRDEGARVRYTGERPAPAATVYTVKNKAGRERHFTIADGPLVVEHASYEAGFGSMLLEPHPTRIIEVRGQLVHPHRYSLCWASLPLYEPRTAEQLAALRVSRERKKVERDEKRFQEENPLLAWAEREQAEKGLEHRRE